MWQPSIASVLLLASIWGRQSHALTTGYKPPPPDVLAAEGLPAQNSSSSGPQPYAQVAAQPAIGAPIDRTNWKITCDSWQYYDWCTNPFDNNPNTIWHTEYTPATSNLPHNIVIDFGLIRNINGLTYLPRQDGSSNGNIGRHEIWTSLDGNYYQLVAYGFWNDDKTQKTAAFELVAARYLKLIALSEAGNRGPWSSAAEINVFDPGYAPYYPNGIGKWGPTIDFPIVPVAVAVEPKTGKVLAWSSYSPNTFVGNQNGGYTFTSTWDPNTKVVTERVVSNTGHDMFCPGLSLDVNGRPIVTGGNSAQQTSIYDPAADNWIQAAQMNIARGYQASATCSDGRIFTIGGSWSGGQGGKNGEIYDPNTNKWTLLGGCPVGPMLTNDAAGVYRADNHGWLFGWKNQYVFQAGPSRAMNWYNTQGNGGQKGAGNRDTDTDAMCGNAVMYDALNGKILTLGGATSYSGAYATSNARLITLGNAGDTPMVWHFSGMYNARVFANAVVLPDGKVFITGGQNYGNPFSDDGAVYTPELWDPNTWGFYKMATNSIPRTYHSVAVLLLDGTVFSGGGGLCGSCSTNHFDAQIYTPQYLLNNDGSYAGRPTIYWVSPDVITTGQTLTIQCAGGISAVSLMRYSSTTHTVDSDQRRIPLNPVNQGGNKYTVVIPNDHGIALPGYWMVFVLDGNGRPSVAKTIKIT